MNTCPKGHGLLINTGNGRYCLACGYTEESDDLSLYAEIMAAVPGGPLERYEKEMSRTYGARRNHQEQQTNDLRLAQEAAARHGVSLEDLRVNMRGWKRIHPKVRFALHAVICDLTISGLGILRIAKTLRKSNRTIEMSPGLARGRARRKHARRETELAEIEALMKEHKGRTLNTLAR